MPWMLVQLAVLTGLLGSVSNSPLTKEEMQAPLRVVLEHVDEYVRKRTDSKLLRDLPPPLDVEMARAIAQSLKHRRVGYLGNSMPIIDYLAAFAGDQNVFDNVCEAIRRLGHPNPKAFSPLFIAKSGRKVQDCLKDRIPLLLGDRLVIGLTDAQRAELAATHGEQIVRSLSLRTLMQYFADHLPVDVMLAAAKTGGVSYHPNILECRGTNCSDLLKRMVEAIRALPKKEPDPEGRFNGTTGAYFRQLNLLMTADAYDFTINAEEEAGKRLVKYFSEIVAVDRNNEPVGASDEMSPQAIMALRKLEPTLIETAIKKNRFRSSTCGGREPGTALRGFFQPDEWLLNLLKSTPYARCTKSIIAASPVSQEWLAKMRIWLSRADVTDVKSLPFENVALIVGLFDGLSPQIQTSMLSAYTKNVRDYRHPELRELAVRLLKTKTADISVQRAAQRYLVAVGPEWSRVELDALRRSPGSRKNDRISSLAACKNTISGQKTLNAYVRDIVADKAGNELVLFQRCGKKTVDLLAQALIKSRGDNLVKSFAAIGKYGVCSRDMVSRMRETFDSSVQNKEHRHLAALGLLHCHAYQVGAVGSSKK